MNMLSSSALAVEALRFWIEHEEVRGLVHLDSEGRIASWNAAAERITGYAAGEAVGRSWTELAALPGEGLQRLQPFLRKDGATVSVSLRMDPLFRDGVLLGFGLILRDADAPSEACAAVCLAGVPVGPGRANPLVEAIRDREARHQATETALRESEERYEFAIRGANDGIWDWNLLTNDVVFSSRWKSMLGYADAELPDHVETWRRLLHPGDRPAVEARVRQFLAKEIDKYEIEFRMSHKDGGYRNVLARGHLVVDDGGRPVRLVGTHVDITDRKQAELALRQSEEMLRRTQAIAYVVGWSFDIAEGSFASSEDESVSMDWRATTPALHPDDVARVRAAWRAASEGAAFEIEYRVMMNGEVRWVYARATTDLDSEGRAERIVGVSQDITARRNLEEQFQQAQKMDAIGQLAGGIAHDFNNLLTVINSSAELLLEEVSPGLLRDGVADIRAAGERAAKLTHQLLAFSRKQILEARVLDLNAVISESEKMLVRLIGEDISVVTILAPSLSMMKADVGQVEQVILNLVVNARDAMPSGGRLTIETKDVILRGDTQIVGEGPSPGRYVELSVTDNGTGIPESIRERIFEPFFTTKSVGKGAGLGLATVYGIVRQSGGHISVASSVGAGTKFTVLFPSASVAPVLADSLAPADSSALGTETILLVEDEDAVRRIARAVLERHGYTIIEANCGSVAVELARQHAGEIHLLVTDVVMPGMCGRKVADILSEMIPGALPVLFMSGYTDDAVVRNGVHDGRDNLLAKPFTARSLIKRVRGALDSKAQPGAVHVTVR